MTTKTIELDGVKITVRRAKLRDRMIADSLMLRLSEALPPVALDMEYYYRQMFGSVVAQTEQTSGLSWSLPSVSASGDELAAAFEQFMNEDSVIGELWIAAIRELNAPPGDVQFLPPEFLAEAERADPN